MAASLSNSVECSRVNWLFLDLNSYFASVEQQVSPELRGKPVAVLPVVAETTCCIAASYEAKAFGVKTGTMVKDARQMCPGIALVPARHEMYIEFHQQILKAVDLCIPVSQVASIDEMACRLLGRERVVENAMEIGRKIKRTIYAKVGECLRCSIGIAPNRMLAKTASNMQKPDGLVAIAPADLPECLYRLMPADLPGIGRRMNARLERHGILTMQQLCQQSPQQMRTLWGSVVGERFWHWLRGEDFEEPESSRSSIGHQHVLAPEERSLERAGMILEKLLHKAATRLRRMKLWTGALSVCVGFSYGRERNVWEGRVRMMECQDTVTLMEVFRKVWEGCPRGKPTFVGLSLHDLVPESLHTSSFFMEEEKRGRIAHVMDSLNGKYGEQTLYVGGRQTSSEAMPPRIAFSYIPEL
ncbi:MAG TPA: hypothetical protein VG892_06885 [Terriglobales bacterium]|nr:hypothetical protein [Terriglobales bacterium]